MRLGANIERERERERERREGDSNPLKTLEDSFHEA